MAITLEQALSAREFHANVGANSERACNSRRGPVKWRRNGKTKTWKRQPERFQIPVKFGLYNHGYITNTNAEGFHTEEDCILNMSPERKADLGIELPGVDF